MPDSDELPTDAKRERMRYGTNLFLLNLFLLCCHTLDGHQEPRLTIFPTGAAFPIHVGLDHYHYRLLLWKLDSARDYPRQRGS